MKSASYHCISLRLLKLRSFNLRKIIIHSLGVLILTACNSSYREGVDPLPQNQADGNVHNSFAIVRTQSAALEEDKYRVHIKRAALGKEFLLSANLLTQTPTPQFAGLQSRVVRFVERADRLILQDVTQTSVVGEGNIPQALLLADFPILSQSQEQYEIDFTAGLKVIFTGTDWSGSDDPSYNGAKYELPLVPVQVSYTEEAGWNDGALFIRQIAQLENKTAKKSEAIPVELRLQFKPYLPDREFQPVVSPGFDQVGFFEANPLLLKNGTTRLYATKWNLNKPIIFYLSANTPKEYREIITSAILYWNKTLGENRIRVEALEDSNLTAPQFNRNVIQWVDWDSAPYAYADANVDPRTGEITSAQVFLPSSFLTADTAARLRLLPVESKTEGFRAGLKGFSFSRLCHRDLNQALHQHGLLADVKNISTANQKRNQKRVVELYFWEVIAHELGHVMGLRHNFAGSLAANYDASERLPMMRKFYETLQVPAGMITTSTVMEYSLFDESAWDSSMLIRPEIPALSYDQMAMNYLYFKKPLPVENRPPFCTDSQMNTYTDCSTGDAGRSIIAFAINSYRTSLRSMAARLLNEFIAKSKVGVAEGEALVPVSQVNLEVKKYSDLVGAHFAKFVSFLKSKQKYIHIRSSLMPLRQNDEASIEQKEKEYLHAEFSRLGGLDNILNPTNGLVSESYAQELIEQFQQILQDPDMTSGDGRDGYHYSFSEEEKSLMLSQVALFAPRFQQALWMNELTALGGDDFELESSYGQNKPDENAKWAAGELTSTLADVLHQRFLEVALGKTGSVIKADFKSNQKDSHVELPIYKYPQMMRVAASKLFRNGHEDIEWGYLQKIEQSEAIENELSLLGDEDKLDKKSLSKEALRWYLSNKQLQSAEGE